MFARFIGVCLLILDGKDIPNKFGVSTHAYTRLRVLFWSARVTVHDTVLTALLLRGVLVDKLCSSLFNPLITLYIYYDQYEYMWGKKQNNCCPRFVSKTKI